MMGEVRRHFRDYSRSMRVPRRLRELHVQIGRTTADLPQQLGRAPTASELRRCWESPARRSSNVSWRAMPIGSIPWTHPWVPTARARPD
jgi:DNA-directed RNA polymerase specialized sigma subunit